MEKLETIHYLLAYAGMIIYTLMKLQEKSKEKGFTCNGWIRKMILPTIISSISIPVILIVATDTALEQLLPINYLTAVLAGAQTSSTFKWVVSVGKKKATNETA